MVEQCQRHSKPMQLMKKEDVIYGVECENVKATEAGIFEVADGKTQFILQKTSMVCVEWCLLQPDWQGLMKSKLKKRWSFSRVETVILEVNVDRKEVLQMGGSQMEFLVKICFLKRETSRE